MTIVKLCVISLCLLILPLLGVFIDGQPVAQYLEFPPKTRYVEQAPFSWSIFMVMSAIVALFVTPFLVRFVRKSREQMRPARYTRKTAPFPVWGWIALGVNIVSWVIAWSRFDWFTPVQRHTFIPLWYSFIIIVNADTVRRCGSCLLLRHPRFFLALFPVSMVFWWFFEYLNRYVQNWYYVGIENFSVVEYVFFASVSFATVLPAVASVQEWLRTFPIIDHTFTNYPVIANEWVDRTTWPILGIAGVGLFLMGIYPDYLYPLLWVSPLFVTLSLYRILMGPKASHMLLGKLSENMFSWILAALVCGFFWEFWNYFSFAKWIYSVPFVYRFQIFEMPILGYAGYLPFGLECATIVYIMTRDKFHT